MRHKRKPPQDVRRRRPVLLSENSTRFPPRENGQGDRSSVGDKEENPASAASKAFAVTVFCISLLGTIICMCLLPKYFAADLKTQTNPFINGFRQVQDAGEDLPPRIMKLFQARWEFEKGKAPNKPLTVTAQQNHGDDGDVSQHNHDQTSDVVELPVTGGWRSSDATQLKAMEKSKCHFDVRYAANLTKAEFAETYQNKEPLLLKFSGGAQDWTDTTTWTRSGLMGKYGDHMAEYGYEESINYNGGRGMETIALKDYVQVHIDVTNASGSDTPYMVDSGLLKYRELQDKIYVPEYLQYFQRPAGLLIIGRSGLGLGWHEHGDGWNGVVFGEKHWYVYNRSVVPPGLHRYEPADWEKYVYKKLPSHRRPLECTQEAGDIVYIPQGFYHSVVNVGETIAVSFRENQVTPLPGQVQFVEAITKFESEEAIRKGADALRVNNVHYHGNPLPDYAVGMFHMRSGDYEAALKNFQAALAVDHFNLLGYLGVTDALSKLGRTTDVEMYFAEAMNTHKSSVQLYEEYGKFRQALGDLGTAIHAYETVLERRPGREDLYRKVLALQKDLVETSFD
ncbi:PREDICTED: uncharacterized protein LOC109469860 [Branchiostoma belcheri]|uniref:Uncharacterized protein LOC109469860 n=1 Tax=Branchiostoma belcheri TaxID=7741 RepID=A0A6P4YR54_BRABE|nr:PREDICTED: uncharacterized protein LOC109469860 [Branchiostoma belcheri]